MRMKHTKFFAWILFCSLVAAALPAARAQEDPGQNLLLLVKIPDIEKLLGNIQNLVSGTPAQNESAQMDNIRMMLGGTDWIDTKRSITLGVVMENSKTSILALVPFLTPNDLFRNMYNAQEGPDYYLIPLPPQQGFLSNPVLEGKLAEASGKPVAGCLVVEAAAGDLLAIAEPMMEASLAKMPEIPGEDGSEAELSSKELGTIMHEMFAIMKQAETLRFGIDIDENSFDILMDIDAMPGTDLAATFIDMGGNSRLMEYPLGMPVEYHTRAYNISGTRNLMRSYLETVYGMLGTDVEMDKVLEMSSITTGETAAGIDITPTGLILKMAGVLTPGTDGEAFIRDSYIPLMESYGRNLSNMAAKESENSPTITIERTEDSLVGPTKVMGVKVLIHAASGKNRGGGNFMNIELRMASLGDLLFIASSDAEIQNLIDGTRDLAPVPAGSPTGRLVLDLTKLMHNLKPLLTEGQPAPGYPDDLGKVATSFDLRDGKMTTRTSLDIDLIRKLISAVASQVPQGGAPTEGEDTGDPGSI